MSRPTSKADRLLFASLHGRACFHVFHHTSLEEAAANLRELATVTPPRRPGQPSPRRTLRVDLPSQVAGHHRGAYEADPVVGWVGQRACQLLVAAGGTDKTLARAAADAVARR